MTNEPVRMSDLQEMVRCIGPYDFSLTDQEVETLARIMITRLNETPKRPDGVSREDHIERYVMPVLEDISALKEKIKAGRT